MALSTNLVSGLASGFDWRSMIDQLIAIERRPVDLVAEQKTEYETKLSEWQSFNTKLLALKSAAEGLKNPGDFSVFTPRMTTDSGSVEGTDLLSITTSSSALPGSYDIEILALAKAQKLSSAPFYSRNEALGTEYAGDILINGTAINISESDDLTDVRDRINNANTGTDATGVQASIVNYGDNDYRLILTSDATGQQGIGLQNGSASDLVERFGWRDKTASLKNSITGGAQSDAFSSKTQAIKTLLGLSTTQTGTIRINGQDVDIDLASDSLEDIKDKIDALTGVSASILTTIDSNVTSYKLQIDETQNFEDSQNILETLGILHNGSGDVQGTTSDNAMTTNGEYITSSTMLNAIDGYYDWTSGDDITISGTDHDNNAVNGTFTISSSATVQDLLNEIETLFEFNGNEISIHVTSEGKIEVADMESGTSSLSVTLTSNITDGDLDWGTFGALDQVREREIAQGQDASVSVDGVIVTSADNSVADVLPGVILNLLNADENTTITLNIDRDIDSIIDKISSFVTAYNEVSAYISQQQAYDEENESPGGVLFGDGTLSSVKSDLTSILIESVEGVSSDFSILGLAGINLDNEGQLNIDSNKLRGYLGSNFDDIKLLFSANGSASSGTIEYLSHSRTTNAGEHTLNITQAATRSTTTSDTAVAATLGGDETLTITTEGRIADIALTSDMTIVDIINSINAELATIYTESLAGSTAVQASGYAITAATKWTDIDGGQLANGDVIAFNGTTRHGSSISGSYTISDTSADAVQGLLSEIESLFDDDVTATIDSTGHLVITDKYAGDSQLSLTFDYTGTLNGVDIFGSVLTSNGGGQEGRNALEITASTDASNRLVLTHDRYGSSHSFTISETSDLLWTGGDQTVANGKDVEGTIHGEAATGSGQTLTGDEGAEDVEGLVINYTGTDTGEVGNILLTLGVAELFDRALFNITDVYDGYLSFKQESLKNSIDLFDSHIEDMEVRLDLKMENMINKFVAMEVALSKMQSQSQWLSGQIDAIYSGWA